MAFAAAPATVSAAPAQTRVVQAVAVRAVLTGENAYDRPSSEALDDAAIRERSVVRASRDSARVAPSFDRPATTLIAVAAASSLVARPRPPTAKSVIAAGKPKPRGTASRKTPDSRPKAVWRQRWVRPAGGRFTSGFKQRWGRMHRGIDLAGPFGTPIVAASNGVVVFAGRTGGYGKLVLIRHSGGIVTAYGHMQKITVSVGEQVSAGERIALVGSEGRSTGPHLHFEVRQNGVPINPLPFLTSRDVRV